MVQESIVDYINTQMKAGVSRDSIKTTLTGAGWAAADVEDTLKKVEAAKTAPAMGATPGMASPATMASKPAAMPMSGGAVNPAPQTIKVSDLVSAGPATSMPATNSAMSASKSPLTGPSPVAKSPTMPATMKPAATSKASSFQAAKPHGSHGALITEIVLVIIILAVGGFAGFLYMQNNNLNSQLSALNGQSAGVNSQLSALQAQMTASTTALTAQIGSLTTEMQELQTELAFYAPSPSAAAGATSTATVTGSVSGGGKLPYIITGTYGGKVYVGNSKDASVISALGPLMATGSSTATVAQFTGTYVPGSDTITLTSVNGTSL